MRCPQEYIFQVRNDRLLEVCALLLHRSTSLGKMQHSGKAGQFPLFFKSKEREKKRTVIADQEPDYDLTLILYPEVSCLTAAYFHSGQYTNGIWPNGFASV